MCCLVLITFNHDIITQDGGVAPKGVVVVIKGAQEMVPSTSFFLLRFYAPEGMLSTLGAGFNLICNYMVVEAARLYYEAFAVWSN